MVNAIWGGSGNRFRKERIVQSAGLKINVDIVDVFTRIHPPIFNGIHANIVSSFG